VTANKTLRDVKEKNLTYLIPAVSGNWQNRTAGARENVLCLKHKVTLRWFSTHSAQATKAHKISF